MEDDNSVKKILLSLDFSKDNKQHKKILRAKLLKMLDRENKPNKSPEKKPAGKKPSIKKSKSVVKKR